MRPLDPGGGWLEPLRLNLGSLLDSPRRHEAVVARALLLLAPEYGACDGPKTAGDQGPWPIATWARQSELDSPIGLAQSG